MPVVVTTGHGVQTRRKLWKYRKCSTLTGWSMFPLFSSPRFGRPRDLAATSSRRQSEVPQIQL